MSNRQQFKQISTLPTDQQERLIARFRQSGRHPDPVSAPRRARSPEVQHCGHPTSAVAKMDPHTARIVTGDAAKSRTDLVEICSACSKVKVVYVEGPQDPRSEVP